MSPTHLLPPAVAHLFADGLAATGPVPETRPPTLAIVGSRAALPEAAEFARTLAAMAVARGMVVVSGGAIGIDTAAHEGALDAGGTTWLVSPVPLGEVTPIENTPLFERVASEGSLIVTRQLRSTILKSSIYFRRNELLVALADAVVVVQASLRSGALNAAKYAREQGVTVWAVPGMPWLSSFAGTNALVEKGYASALSRPELLFASDASPPRRADAPPTQIPLEATALLGAMGQKSMHVDEIIGESGLPGHEVSVHLLTLAALGVVLEHPPGWYRRLR
jgi:DNA processing protein